MSSLHKIIRKKYLACVEKLKKKDLVTDDEYNVVSGCKLNDLLHLESTPSILDQICEGEKWHTAEFYDQQEKKYHIHVAKIYRKVKVKPTLPRIVEVEVAVPAPASDNVPESAAIPTPCEPTDAIRESPDAESNGQPRDPYQMVEEAPQLEQPIALSAYDEHFGSKDVDGTRDFLELCTGINFPPTTLAEPSTQQLLLAELGISARPLNNNFQEIDLRDIGTLLFENPLETSTPFVEAGARRKQQPTHLEQDVMPTTNMSTLSDHGQLLTQHPEEGRSVAMSTKDVAPNAVTNEAILSGEIPDAVVPVSEDVPRRQDTVQADQNGGAVAAERSSSSVSPVEISPPNPRSRRSTDFTRRLPPLEDILPRPRRSFDIFSYHHQSNLYPMIEYVQSQLFHRQPEPQPQPQPQALVDSSLVMRAAVGHNATWEPSTLHESNDQASRDPFVTPAVEISNNRSLGHPIDHQLPDQMQSADMITNVPLMTTLASLDTPMIETLENLRLPSLVTVCFGYKLN
uniref:Uncharacterized protein n=1 Tax=Anopheles atroparvus TaxID=41427 RepID=A0AAG5DQL5_ANOAO